MPRGASTRPLVVLAAALLAMALLAAPASAGEPLRFEVVAGSAAPKAAYVDGVEPVRLKYRFNASRRVDVRVAVRKRGGGLVERFDRLDSAPGLAHTVRWRGTSSAGRAAPEGAYDLLVGRRGHRLVRVAGFRLRGHAFPVDGPHGGRGYIGSFGAPRSGGRTHEGLDITAACGTPILAARGGVVKRSFYDPVLYGNAVLIAGIGERRTYFYSHLLKTPLVRAGQRVRTGQRLGAVGQTGNAASTPCHLHFELRDHGSLIDPAPVVAGWKTP